LADIQQKQINLPPNVRAIINQHLKVKALGASTDPNAPADPTAPPVTTPTPPADPSIAGGDQTDPTDPDGVGQQVLSGQVVIPGPQMQALEQGIQPVMGQFVGMDIDMAVQAV